MRNFVFRCFVLGSFLLLVVVLHGQKQRSHPLRRCETMEELNRIVQNNPAVLTQWKAEGQRRYNAWLQRVAVQGNRTEAGEIIIPIVFHIVDSAQRQAWVTDRDIYEQVEILNRDYSGRKADNYKGLVPAEISNRVGRVPIRFVLARRAPNGTISSGIERRVGASPDHVNIKSTATGGLDAWDVNQYVNVWCGTFSGSEAGLLGIATFPFTTGNGAQGVVIGTATLPFTSSVARSYYPTYAEGATLSHELGHYFYLWHTFGDNAACNNADFRIQDGWPLAAGAGPEGDDTPDQKGNPGTDGFVYGNPSQNYNVGCIDVPYGIVYGSFMNYFDDRSLFMFTDGQRKRVESCIELYRPGLLASNGGSAPTVANDAYIVTSIPRGTPERRATVVSNTPLKAVVRNYGNNTLLSVTISWRLDAGATSSNSYPLTLLPGTDTTLTIGTLSAAAGGHTITIYSTQPNGGSDAFTNNDTLQSYIIVHGGGISAPFTEGFNSASFPPSQWLVFNPNGNAWTRSSTAGLAAAGAAFYNNYNINQVGTLDEIISPAIDFGSSDSSVLSFNVAYGAYDLTDVSAWDGLEVYVSGDNGLSYSEVFKKTGTALKTVEGPQTDAFVATPAQPERWRTEKINLTPYIVPGQKMLIRFRNTNAFGNNLYMDDIGVSAATLPTRDAAVVSLVNLPAVICGGSSITPTVLFANKGKDTITSLKINYRLDNGAVTTLTYSGTLTRLQTAQKVLNTISNIPAGNHTLTVYSSDPNGLPDQVTNNDTLLVNLVVLAPVPSPVREGFEGTSFPPANWIVVKSNDAHSWERTNQASSSGTASALIRDFVLKTAGAKDDLYAPLVQINNPDSVFLKFDVAHVNGQYPGSTSVPLDTLEVLLTKDCGVSFTSVYKKWGYQLQTNGDPNFPVVYPASDTIGFVPSGAANWRTDSVDLTRQLGGSSGNFQVLFRSISNGGNNIYLDNVNINAVTLPSKLKSQGYLITPNPSNGAVNVRHYGNPATLKGVQVFSATGQLLLQQTYNGNAPSWIALDLTRFANGIYSIRLVYDNKVVTDRISKIR